MVAQGPRSRDYRAHVLSMFLTRSVGIRLLWSISTVCVLVAIVGQFVAQSDFRAQPDSSAPRLFGRATDRVLPDLDSGVGGALEPLNLPESLTSSKGGLGTLSHEFLIDSGARRLEENEIDDEKYKRKIYDEGLSTCPKEAEVPWCKRSEDEGHQRYGRYGDTWDLHRKAQSDSAKKKSHSEVCTRLIKGEAVLMVALFDPGGLGSGAGCRHSKFWRVCSWLYRSRFLRVNIH